MSNPTAIIYIERDGREIEVFVTAGSIQTGRPEVFRQEPGEPDCIEGIEARDVNGDPVELTNQETEKAEAAILKEIEALRRQNR